MINLNKIIWMFAGAIIFGALSFNAVAERGGFGSHMSVSNHSFSAPSGGGHFGGFHQQAFSGHSGFGENHFSFNQSFNDRPAMPQHFENRSFMNHESFSSANHAAMGEKNFEHSSAAAQPQFSHHGTIDAGRNFANHQNLDNHQNFNNNLSSSKNQGFNHHQNFDSHHVFINNHNHRGFDHDFDDFRSFHHHHHNFIFFGFPFYWYYGPYWDYYPYDYPYMYPYTYNYYEYNYGNNYDANSYSNPNDNQQQLNNQNESQTPANSSQESALDQQLDSIAQPFYKGDYDKAVLNAEEAVSANPDNSVLLFAYSQSLFAAGQYDRSAIAVRDAITLVNGKKEDMFYANSFYGMQGVLNAQVNKLEQVAQQQPANTNLQLLLGYQLWGVGRFDEAAVTLQKIQKDPVNGTSATFLAGIVEHSQQLVNQNAPKENSTETNIQK